MEENKTNTDILDEMISEQGGEVEELPTLKEEVAPIEETTPTGTLNDGSIHENKPIEDKSIWDTLRKVKEERELELNGDGQEPEINRNIIPNDIPGVVPTPVQKVKEKKGIQPIHMFILLIVLMVIGIGVFIYYNATYVDDGSNRAQEYTTTTTTIPTKSTTAKPQ